MSKKSLNSNVQWPFVTTGEILEQLGISSELLKKLRTSNALTKGLYWTTLPNSDRIFWNRDLIRDWFVNQNNSSHQKAIEKYIATLPSC
jgi:hypothetical protein